ncbi:MAG: phage tail family protein [Deltaproteobacteria bacterium]|nr:phage tail family protein [Deltaproteobacteria bacterium]
MTVTTTITWIPASGSQIVLNNEVNYYVLVGLLGGESPSFKFIEERFPGLYGSYVRQVDVEPRTLSIPIKIVDSNLADLKDRIRELVVALSPLLGLGKLKFETGSTVRYLDCYYSGGLEGSDSLDLWGFDWIKGLIQFYAPFPYFYGNAIETIYELGSGLEDFLTDPFFPMSIGESTVLGDDIIDNIGQIESWPVWTITGPGSSITLTNEDTGEEISLTGAGGLTLASSEVIEIDTRPGYKSITKISNGANYFRYLSDASILWSLDSGSVNINTAVTSATSVTEILLSFKPFYAGRP